MISLGAAREDGRPNLREAGAIRLAFARLRAFSKLVGEGRAICGQCRGHIKLPLA